MRCSVNRLDTKFFLVSMLLKCAKHKTLFSAPSHKSTHSTFDLGETPDISGYVLSLTFFFNFFHIIIHTNDRKINIK